MKYSPILIAILLLLLVTSCKTNQTKYGTKVGRWVYKSTIENSEDIHKGRYDKEGYQKGKWVYRLDGKRYKKERIKGDTIYITTYHPNKKVAEKGYALLKETKKLIHYYYHGDWMVYDTEGKLVRIKKYDTGVLQD